MQILFMAVSGKLPPWLEELSDDYNKRLSRWIKTERVLLKSPKLPREDAAVKISAESDQILSQIKPGDFVILCDERGKSFSSLAFSGQLGKILNRGAKRVVFLIGGAYGVADAVKERSEMCLSLSPLTMNHHLALAILSEQVYRAMTILKGVRYHNE